MKTLAYGKFSALVMALSLAAVTGCHHMGMHGAHHEVMSSTAFMPHAGDVRSGAYDIDGGHSSVFFSVRHFNVSHFTGRFNEVSGKVMVSDRPEQCSIEIKVPTASIDTNSEARDTHLKGNDFFAATEHPEMTFVSRKWKERAPGIYEVEGMLSLRGVEKMITAHVQCVGAAECGPPLGGYRCGFDASFAIERKDFGMEAYLGGPDLESGGVGNTILVHVNLEAAMPAAPMES